MGPCLVFSFFTFLTVQQVLKLRIFGGKIQVVVDNPPKFQAQHEEAATLVAFHATQIGEGAIMLIRSCGSDVLVILIGLVGRCCASIIMNYVSGHNPRYINVTLHDYQQP